MSVQTVYRCDVCGKQKGEANHWCLYIQAPTRIVFQPWSEEGANEGTGHLCGQACATRKLQSFLEKPEIVL